jgi:hypothetical protein
MTIKANNQDKQATGFFRRGSQMAMLHVRQKVQAGTLPLLEFV